MVTCLFASRIRFGGLRAVGFRGGRSTRRPTLHFVARDRATCSPSRSPPPMSAACLVLPCIIAFNRHIESIPGVKLGRDAAAADADRAPDNEQMVDRPVKKPVTDDIRTRQDREKDRKRRDQTVDGQPDQMPVPLPRDVILPDCQNLVISPTTPGDAARSILPTAIATTSTRPGATMSGANPSIAAASGKAGFRLVPAFLELGELRLSQPAKPGLSLSGSIAAGLRLLRRLRLVRVEEELLVIDQQQVNLHEDSTGTSTCQ